LITINDKLTPVKYGKGVMLIFNNDAAQNVVINHTGYLNIMESKSVFEIVKKSNPNDIGDIVNIDEDVLIRREGTKSYLKVTNDRVITNAKD